MTKCDLLSAKDLASSVLVIGQDIADLLKLNATRNPNIGKGDSISAVSEEHEDDLTDNTPYLVISEVG